MSNNENSYYTILSFDLYKTVQATLKAPSYHIIFEALLIVWIIKLLFFTKSYKPKRHHLTEAEKDELIKEWEPEPLAPSYDENDEIINNYDNRIVDGKIGKYMTVSGAKCLNLSSLNFLGMIGRHEIEDAAIKTISHYGVGSCGPRGFYGTVDVHLKLEEELQTFMQVEEAILYSFGFTTIASAIPAYSKRGDVIFADNGVSFSVQKGIQASRSTVFWFKHNDVEDLILQLEKQSMEDKKNPSKAKVTRRFLIIEGLYMNYGDICPLPKYVELKEQYKFRLFIDESISFGTLGKNGRGVTEHFSIPIDEIDLMCASLENAIGSIGGFACGKGYIVDHQRLSGLGYCFSASQPPMMAIAAIEALNIMKAENELIVELKNNCQIMHKKLETLKHFKLLGDPISCIKHLQLSKKRDRNESETILNNIVKTAQEKEIAIVTAAYINDQEKFLPEPSIRIAVCSQLTKNEIENAVRILNDVAENILTI